MRHGWKVIGFSGKGPVISSSLQATDAGSESKSRGTCLSVTEVDPVPRR